MVCWRKKQLKRELLEIWGAWAQKYRLARLLKAQRKKRLGSDRRTEVETILKGVAKADRMSLPGAELEKDRLRKGETQNFKQRRPFNCMRLLVSYEAAIDGV